jgi:DNA repair photolyase
VDWNPEDDPLPRTQFLKDHSQTIIATNESPDVGFETSINPYRGCEHGCIYCYARPFHEYLGFSSGLDFESKIMVKEDAAALLRRELSSPKWEPQLIALSGVTDCYQPAEKKMRLTRGCLEVLAEFRNPAIIITKNHLVTRDVDLLAELARHRAVVVHLSITTLDPHLARAMEPRASIPAKRLEAVRILADAGVPVGVLVAPIIPGLSDHEVPALIDEAANAGATHAGYTILRLPYAVKDLFTHWLEQNFPDRSAKVLNRVRELRDGKLNRSNFGERFHAKGVFAEQIRALFDVACRKSGLATHWPEVSVESFRRPEEPKAQMRLFG